MTTPIRIKQATLHNLKNIDLDIPKDRLVAVTGVSGSGKSTLAFDILYEAGRRAYLQAIGILGGIGEQRGYEQISGLRPAIAVKQGITRRSNPRSVVGTRTRALTILATLFADEINRRDNADQSLTASHFSFNSPVGMCLSCEGRGYDFALNLDALLPTPKTTLQDLYRNADVSSRFDKAATRLATRFDFDIQAPFLSLPQEVQDIVLYGRNPGGKKRVGLIDHLQHRLQRGIEIGNTLVVGVCHACSGYRVGTEAREHTLNNKHIGELGSLTIRELSQFLKRYQLGLQSRPADETQTASLLMQRLNGILDNLIQVNLDYLTLYRPIPTLSGGEAQRLSLMTCFGSDLESLLYIFDEPTAGLHESEKQSLIEMLKSLRSMGHAVVVVEHDYQVIKSAEYVIDMGPFAGHQGGRVVYAGEPDGFSVCEDSITARYLTGHEHHQRTTHYQRFSASKPHLELTGVSTNNLKNVDVKIPLGMIVGVAGVSGSGKSSLIGDTLVPILEERFTVDHDHSTIDPSVGLTRSVPRLTSITGIEHLSQCVEVGQSAIGRRTNSNPATYLGIWGRIRAHFASQPLAVQRDYGPGHFSFNAKGACEHCQGTGQHHMWIGSTFVNYTCESCKGQRYQPDILDIKFQDKTITEVLQMSADAALPFFQADKPIRRMLSTLVKTGMGYITLGQPTSTLSGGEAQRIKLAKQLGRGIEPAATLFVFDEPTTGLSQHDTAMLLSIVDRLIEQGNTVVLIEHDPATLSYCDWILELGPASGEHGGRVISQGTPKDLSQRKSSQIGPYLVPFQTTKIP